MAHNQPDVEGTRSDGHTFRPDNERLQHLRHRSFHPPRGPHHPRRPLRKRPRPKLKLKLKKHGIAKGHFELAIPADWTLKEEKPESWQQDANVATNLRIQNGQGQDMAVFITGGAGPTSLSLVNDGATYTQLGSAKPKLTASSFYSFEVLGRRHEAGRP